MESLHMNLLSTSAKKGAGKTPNGIIPQLCLMLSGVDFIDIQFYIYKDIKKSNAASTLRSIGSREPARECPSIEENATWQNYFEMQLRKCS
jgi:hypothetical protein